MAPGTHYSKPNEARLVEREVCFISYAGNWGGRADVCPKDNSPCTGNQWAKTFIDRSVAGGLDAETAVISQVSSNWSSVV